MELGIYRHWKGKEYRVIGVAKHSETLEDLVIYIPLYKNDLSMLWARPITNFNEELNIDGKIVKRFEFVREQ